MASRRITYLGESLEIAYIKQACQKAQEPRNIVFLHGWGSHKELMHQAFAKSFADYTHYYIDLPGFGASPYGEELESKVDSSLDTQELRILDTSDYAHIVLAFLRELGIRADIVGHSFGGKVAVMCGKLDSSCVGDIILLSSAGIVCKKPLKVRAKIACAKIAKALHIRLPFLRASDAKSLNPTMYSIFKRVVDEDFSPIFAACRHNVSIFWGRNDTATPLESGEQIHALIPSSRLFVLEGDHYFFINQATRIESMYHSQAWHIKVCGKVQGVGYRKFAKAKADELGLKGSAQNLPDGSVEIFVCGDESGAARFLQALWVGPSKSQVQEVHSEPCVLEQEWLAGGFRILT